MISKELLCVVSLIGVVSAAVPSYIKVCGAKSKDLNQCILDSVASLNSKLRTGMPELDVPPIDPLKIDQIKLVDTPTFHATARNVILTGFGDHQVKHLHCDLEKQQIDLDAHFDLILLDAAYNVSAKILVPLAGRGPIHVESKDINAKVKMNWKIVNRNGKKYMFFPAMTTKLTIGDYTAKFRTEGIDKTLEDAINQAFSDSHKELLDATTPNLERAISQRVLELSNKICKHFTFDELFPDRE